MALNPSQVRALIVQMARQRGVDPQAALAVSSVEGGYGGAIGDQGTSFGPFQLHEGGALPSGRGNAWANSPAGIAYALDQIARVSKGQTGAQAISSIVNQFERPANPQAEIQRALGQLGAAGASGVPGNGARAMGNPGLPGGSDNQRALAMALLNPKLQANPLALVKTIQAIRGQATEGAVNATGGPQTDSNTQGGPMSILPQGAKYQAERQDHGRDFITTPGGPVLAPGSGVVVDTPSDPNGFGPRYPVVRFTSGPFAGKTMYFGHTITSLKPGQQVRPGDILSRTSAQGGIGSATVPGWVEVGFGHPGTPSYGAGGPPF